MNPFPQPSDASGIDALKAVSAEAADMVLRGQAKVIKEMIYEFPELPVEVIAEIADQIIRGEPIRRLPAKKTPNSNRLICHP